MNPIRINSIALITLVFAATSAFGDDRTVVPYEKMRMPMEAVASQNVDGVDYTLFYLSHTKEGAALDSKIARFRIETVDGKTLPLKCELLTGIDETNRSNEDRIMIQKGSSHRLWVPKDLQKYANAKLVWDLPPGSLNFIFGEAVPIKAPTKAR